MASLIHPGHPLMQSVTDIVLEQHRNKLKQGTVLVDPGDLGLSPKVLFIIDHAVKEGSEHNRIVSRQIHFISVSPKQNEPGVSVENAGWAPHLDLEALDEGDRPLIQDVLNAAWITQNLEQQALAHASTHLVPEHFAEVRNRREHSVDKILRAVHERLVKEINFWSDRYIKFKDDMAAGKDVRLTLDNVRRTIDDLTARREAREKDLLAMRHVISATPVVVGGALVIPAGLLAQRKGQPGWTADADARSRIEYIAMQAVMKHEQAQGYEVFDVSAQKCGWDVTSLAKSADGKPSSTHHIEVKGRAKGQSTITVSRNEILYGLNQADKFMLAIVIVEGDQYEGPYYLRNPFTQALVALACGGVLGLSNQPTHGNAKVADLFFFGFVALATQNARTLIEQTTEGLCGFSQCGVVCAVHKVLRDDATFNVSVVASADAQNRFVGAHIKFTRRF